MTECNKTTTVADLPVCDSTSGDSYLIVQNGDNACKVKLSDLVLGPENVDFYPALIDIINKLDSLLTAVQPNSAKWNETHTTVTTNKTKWDDAGAEVYTTALKSRMDAGETKWNNAADAYISNGSNWNHAAEVVQANESNWNDAYNIIQLKQHDWNSAYTITTEGVLGAFHEAFERVTTAPWWNDHTDWGDGTNGTNGPTKAQVYQAWSYYSLKSEKIDAVLTQVQAGSANWNASHT
jgi:hypothetical protein